MPSSLGELNEKAAQPMDNEKLAGDNFSGQRWIDEHRSRNRPKVP